MHTILFTMNMQQRVQVAQTRRACIVVPIFPG